MKTDLVLADKISDLCGKILNLEYGYDGYTFKVDLSKKYSGEIEISPENIEGYIKCTLTIYRKASGLKAHVIIIAQPISSSGKLISWWSGPFSRGILTSSLVEHDVIRGGKVILFDLEQCVQIIQQHEEKLAYIKLLEKFGV